MAGVAITTIAAPAAVIAAAGVGIGVAAYSTNKGIDYLWEKYHWDNVLNKLW